MKFAVLALVSVATATAVKTCADTDTAFVAGDTCTCADIAKPDSCLTKLNTKTVADIKPKVLTAAQKKAEAKTEAAMTSTEKAAAKKALAKTLSGYKSAAATAKGKWDKCSKAAKVASKTKPAVIDFDCQTDLLTWKENDAYYKEFNTALASSGGAVVGIIVGCCVGALVLGGCALWYFKYHKKSGGAAAEFNHDDLYEAFVDSDQA